MKYLAELLDDVYTTWSKKKIFISAPTGIGKTSFIVKKYLSYIRETQSLRKGKVLILCNRKLLRRQYWYDLIQEFNTLSELNSIVDLKTYQELADDIQNKRKGNVEGLFYDYCSIVCDEAHYFYADADFNPFGTYVLLRIILHAAAPKTVIFMTATMRKVKPLIERCLNDEKEWHSRRQICDVSTPFNDYANSYEIVPYDFNYLANYERFQCKSVPDMASLCMLLAQSEYKSIVYIDNKDVAADMAKYFLESGALKKQDVAQLSSENLDADDMKRVVDPLVINHKVLPKVIITTSVLDNGVSIHDPDIENVAIITESEVSFMQMLGRIRNDSNRRPINLIFLERNATVFRERATKYSDEMNAFIRAKKHGTKVNMCSSIGMDILQGVWGHNADEEGLLKKIYIPCDIEIPVNLCNVRLTTGQGAKEYSFLINDFGMAKTGDMMITESLLYKLALQDPVQVIYEQMKWIGKEPDELDRKESSYILETQKKFIDEVSKINKFSKEQLAKTKVKLCKDYRKDLFPEIVNKNVIFSTDKFRKILAKYGYKLIQEMHEGHVIYTVESVKEGKEENE